MLTPFQGYLSLFIYYLKTAFSSFLYFFVYSINRNYLQLINKLIKIKDQFNIITVI